jgi:hypothetical protein
VLHPGLPGKRWKPSLSHLSKHSLVCQILQQRVPAPCAHVAYTGSCQEVTHQRCTPACQGNGGNPRSAAWPNTAWSARFCNSVFQPPVARLPLQAPFPSP